MQRTVLPGYETNSFLIFDRPGGHAALVDAGGPMEEHVETLAEQSLELTHVLLTHHHPDHVLHAEKYRSRFGSKVCAHDFTGEQWGGLDRVLADGDTLQIGELAVRTIFVPGHTLGHLAFVVNEERVFTGDTLFRGSVGGTRGPGHGSLEQLRTSIMGRLMTLPAECVVHPGHVDDSTVATEWASNPFVLAWSEEEEPEGRAGEAFGCSARILVSARDYDGGTKHWVRFEDGTEDIAPGSKVTFAA